MDLIVFRGVKSTNNFLLPDRCISASVIPSCATQFSRTDIQIIHIPKGMPALYCGDYQIQNDLLPEFEIIFKIPRFKNDYKSIHKDMDIDGSKYQVTTYSFEE
jgi:hypothetical protein